MVTSPDLQQVAVTCESASPVTLTKLAELAHGEIRPFASFPILAFQVRERDIAALKLVEGVEYVHSSVPSTYIRLLEIMDELCQAPDEARSELGIVQNVSMSPGPGPFVEKEPLNIATRAASERGFIFVLAAGNDGPTENTLSPWSVAPWVIGVGAADWEGTTVWNDSSIGMPGSPLYQVTVMAHGQDVPVLSLPNVDLRRRHGTTVALIASGYQPGPNEETVLGSGTSLAAPQVSFLCAFLITFLGQLQYFDAAQRDNRIRETVNWPVMAFLSELARRRVDYSIQVTSTLVRKMLMDMATPMPNYATHQVGAGFVDQRILEAYLKSFLPSRFLALFVNENGSSGEAAELDHRFGPLVPVEGVDRMLSSTREKLRLASFSVLSDPE